MSLRSPEEGIPLTHRADGESPAEDGPPRSAGGDGPADARTADARPAGSPLPLPEVSAANRDAVVSVVAEWFDGAERDLPWRDPDTSAWGVLVSEVMSQQTPVSRVAPRWIEWMERWPRPSDLAAAAPADVLLAWDSLGYPRRALRLQETARAVAADHGDVVPHDLDALRALPGIGAYTAAAVASFAYGIRTTVLDVNVRRVLARVFAGAEGRPGALSRREEAWSSQFVPQEGHVRWNAGAMEFGALVCTARSPRCDDCPLAAMCAWREAGFPVSEKPVRRPQAWHGTDRQLRGAIMRVLRAAAQSDAIDGSSDAVGGSSVAESALVSPVARLSAAEAAAVEALPDAVRTAIGALRDLDAGGERTSRLLADLVSDGLAVRIEAADGARVSLPH